MTDLPHLPELPEHPFGFAGMVFLELTFQGRSIFVRLDAIVTARSVDDGTVIQLDSGIVYTVAEPVEVIFERMAEVLSDG